jgi:hypothetical protein
MQERGCLTPREGGRRADDVIGDVLVDVVPPV